MKHIHAFLSTLTLGAPAGTPQLTVFPLVAISSRAPTYDTLKDAIGSGHARVTEVSAAGSVPELCVDNVGARPILVVDGEELVGAKQNRIVNITILVPAETALTIPVSCVEQGRWSALSAEFGLADRAYHATGRRAKVTQVSASMAASTADSDDLGQSQTLGQSHRTGRSRVSRHADQGAIWSEIAEKSRRMRATSGTGAAAAMFEQKATELNAFVRELRPVDGQVGAIFVIRGVIAGLDVFDAPGTWQRLAPTLVRSYGLDALDDVQGGNGFATPDPAAFVAAIASAPAEEFPAVGLGTDVRLSGNGTVGGGVIVDGRVVHLVAFPAEGTARPMVRRRMRVY